MDEGGCLMEEGPLKTAMDAPTDGVIQQKFVTYVIEDDNCLIKRTVTRKFNSNGDYHDSSTSEPLTW